jgi:molecular chaperone GrpE
MNEQANENEQPEEAEPTEAARKPEDQLEEIDLSDLDEVDETADPADAAEEPAPPTYEELQSEVAALKDQLLRALAETENIRRRGERERADLSKYAIANFAREIVSVGDNLKRAMDSVDQATLEANEEFKNLYTGIEITAKELPAAFDRFGIKPIEAMGKRFDHNFHQAMFELEDVSQPTGTVVQVVQGGYMIHDRLLRPAMVGVSKGGPKAEDRVAEASPPEAAAAAAGQSEKAAADTTAAYEKRVDAETDDGDSGSKLDTEL